MSHQQPSINLLVPTLLRHDAVGNDVHGMYRVLAAAGYPVRIFAAEVHPYYETIAERACEDLDLWNDPDGLLIYHHAIGWPLGESILARTRNKVAVKYHNITPPHFYRQYSLDHYNVCVEGQAATKRISRLRSAMFWGDSQFNVEDLLALGAPAERCRSLPPCHAIEELCTVPLDSHILGTYRDGSLNVLFVGGMRPNKGHAMALKAYAAYRHVYSERIRLIFAGSIDPKLAAYTSQLENLAQNLGATADLVFAPSVSDLQLRTLYHIADAFLCVSEHEGFCVPLIEAMALRVPIVALGRTAVPGTLGDVGVVYDSFDPLIFAASLDQCRSEPDRKLDMVDRGRLRYEALFHPSVIGKQLLALVRELEDAPRA